MWIVARLICKRIGRGKNLELNFDNEVGLNKDEIDDMLYSIATM